MAAYDALIDVLIKEHEHDRARKELSSLVNAKKTAYGDPSAELADCYQLIGEGQLHVWNNNISHLVIGNNWSILLVPFSISSAQARFYS